MSSRRIAGPTDYLPVRNVRPPSPVLYSANPAPLHLHSLLEQSDSNSSGNTSITANSVPGEGDSMSCSVCVVDNYFYLWEPRIVELYVCIWRDFNLEVYFVIAKIKDIIRTVVRIVGMGRMSHICNTKCSRL